MPGVGFPVAVAVEGFFEVAASKCRPRCPPYEEVGDFAAGEPRRGRAAVHRRPCGAGPGQGGAHRTGGGELSPVRVQPETNSASKAQLPLPRLAH